MIMKLLPCLGKYKKFAILSPITVTGEVLIEIFIPFLMAKIIDVGIAEANVPYILRVGGLMVVMALISLTLGALCGRFASVASTGFAKGIRERLFGKIQDFSFANVDKYSTASLVTRLTTDVTYAQNAFMMLIRSLVRSPIMLVGATLMAVTINKELSLVFILVIPILGSALAFIMIRVHPRFVRMFQKYDAMNASVQENLIAIRVVKAFVRRDYENQKFRDSADDLRVSQLLAEKLIIFTSPVMQLTMYACMLAIAWFGGNLIIGGEMLTGELMSYLSYATQILMSLLMIAFSFVGIVISRASVERIVEVLDEKIDISDAEADPSLTVRDGSIEFRNVSFSYARDGGNLTLENIQLKIRSGETVGIIGGTGSAKTSLVQLIPRLYDVYGGSVVVGGNDVRRYKLETLRGAVAMVLQKNVLFSGTIRENLLWGNESAADEEIEAACRAAQAHDFIMSFPNGYETDLGQGGVNVSGGQKQRLCIARALLKKPKILILDDSTSAVDTATDSKIRQAFRETLADTTKIIIAQRISSVSDADIIIVLNDGKIDAVGTHDELLAENAIYREVYQSQQKGAESEI